MAELIPRSVLFGDPERTSPRLAPDGRWLAWLAPSAGVLNVWVAPVAAVGGAGIDWAAARVVTEDDDRGIRAFLWAHDGRHLLYVQDRGGDENWRLHDVDLETMERRDLTPYDGVRVEIVGTEPTRPSEVLVGLNLDNPELHDVYRVDLSSGALTKVVENPGFIGWLADGELEVRAGAALEDDGSLVVMVRDRAERSGAEERGEGEWRPMVKLSADDAISTELVGFDGPETVLALTSKDAETARLVRFSLADGASQVLVEDAEADVTSVRLHPLTRRPQIATVTRERARHLAVDPELAEELDQMRALDDGDLQLLGGDDADRRWLLGFNRDDGAARIHLFDRDTGSATFLFEDRPELARYELARMEPFTFPARDGLVLHGYATFPAEVPRAGLATVLFVHGGPWARDFWGYSAEAQWLANRGYLCLQVNYRGSTGYGKSFLAAGDREWGAKMEEDLVDTVRHAVERGWSDPAKVAISGASYGGYAALMGAALSPPVFCCAVDLVGPTNLKALIETVPPYWVPLLSQFYRRVGDPAVDEDLLWSRSPLAHLDQMSIPLLIAQGANDPRVKKDQAEQIVAALQRAGIDHEYLLFSDEGHGFAKPENRMAFYAAVERFFARHLGGRCEA